MLDKKCLLRQASLINLFVGGATGRGYESSPFYLKIAGLERQRAILACAGLQREHREKRSFSPAFTYQKMGHRPVKKDKVLTRQWMEKLTTKRLLAYRNSLLRCWPTSKDEFFGGVRGIETRLCKDQPEWKEAYKTCLSVLNTREHVERKKKKSKKC